MRKIPQTQVVDGLVTAFMADVVPERLQPVLRGKVQAEVQRAVAQIAQATRHQPIRSKECFRQIVREVLPTVLALCAETKTAAEPRVH